MARNGFGAAALVVAVSIFVACGGGSGAKATPTVPATATATEAPTATATMSPAETIMRGLFGDKCSSCHADRADWRSAQPHATPSVPPSGG